MSPYRLGLLLLSMWAVSGTVIAREVRLQSGGGSDGACPEAIAQAKQAGVQPRASRVRTRAAPAPRAGADDETGSRPPTPRWHSYLPGMFR